MATVSSRQRALIASTDLDTIADLSRLGEARTRLQKPVLKLNGVNGSGRHPCVAKI